MREGPRKRDSERRWWRDTDREPRGDNNNERNPDELVHEKGLNCVSTPLCAFIASTTLSKAKGLKTYLKHILYFAFVGTYYIKFKVSHVFFSSQYRIEPNDLHHGFIIVDASKLPWSFPDNEKNSTTDF